MLFFVQNQTKGKLVFFILGETKKEQKVKKEIVVFLEAKGKRFFSF